MDVNGGFYPNANGSPIFPGTAFTGPLLAGNVFHGDGSSSLAGLGETNIGQANVGYAQMVQTVVVTQPLSGSTTVTTQLIIPAQSQITDIYAMVTATVTGSAATFGIGTTASNTAFTAANAVNGGTLGQITSISPGTSATAIANWDNVSNATAQSSGPQDVQVTVTFTNLGSSTSGSITLTVFYIQGINNAS